MKRLFPSVLIAAMALGVPAASADEPSASAKIRDNGTIYAGFPAADGILEVWVNYERVITPGPTVDPGSLFPIVVDPNDPPEPPAGAIQESMTYSGYAIYCDWNIGCWDTGISNATVPAGFLTIEDAPLAGNAITIDGALEMNGPMPFTLDLNVRAARPGVTRLWTDNAVVHPNVWSDGSEAHAGTDTYVPLLTRHTYQVNGSATGPFGTVTSAYSGAGFNRQIDASTSIDVPA